MSANPDVALFSRVDHTSDAQFFVRFMEEGHRIPTIQTGKSLIRQRLGLASGDAVLDVGCGPGISTLEMANVVGPVGRVDGVDASETMIAAARRRAETTSVPVAFAVGDASALPYEDATFDICHAERLLMHVANPDKVLAEMVRVTRLGGRIGVFDVDWDTMIIDSPDKETTRTIVGTFSDTIRQPWIGRQLPRLLPNHGLKDVSVDAVPVFVPYSFAELLIGGHCTRLQTQGIVSTARMHQWWEDLARAAERGVFLLGFTAFIVAGVKEGPTPK